MDFDLLAQSFVLIMQPMNLIIIMLSVTMGIIIGALPGLTVVMACALLVPLTYGFPAIQSFISLLGIYCGAVYGGSVSAILLGIPGTPAAAATMIDGFALCKKGQAGKALGIACIASSVAGIFSALVMTFLSPQVAKISLLFGPVEYFGIAFFALSILVLLAGKSLLKGFTAILVGLLCTTIGIEPLTGGIRFTFGNETLTSGLDLIPVAVGLFGFSQVFDDVMAIRSGRSVKKVQTLQNLLPKWRELRRIAPVIGKSSLIGTFIGVIPGIGPETASFIGYGEAKRSSKNRDQFGHGAIEGVAAPEAGNNGVTGGAMIPMLTLGVPGDAPTAILLGGLMLHGLTVGPMLFRDSLNFVYPIFIGFIIANIFMGVIGLSLARVFARVISIRQELLLPVICVFCFVGAYATRLSLFDVGVAMGFGLLGFYFNRNDYPVSPILVAIILGPMLEMNMANALNVGNGSFMVFLSTPVGAIFVILAWLNIGLALYNRYRKQNRPPAGADSTGG